MAPSAVDTQVQTDIPINVKTIPREPLELSGSLKDLKQHDVTPAIGREFPEANLIDLLNAPNSDELIRDLAITSKTIQTHLLHHSRFNHP